MCVWLSRHINKVWKQTQNNQVVAIDMRGVRMSKYDKMKRQQDALHAAEQSQYDLATRGMSELASDSKQTAEVYSHAAQVLAEIDSRFEAATSLQKADVAFLFFATALQCVRQYLITNRTDRLTDQEAAKETKGHNEEHSNRVDGDWFLPSIPEIIANPVPYDATRQTEIVKQQAALKGAGDMGHRLVLGHDPILGWVFGTSNIATSTLTNWKLNTYHIRSTAFRKGSTAMVDQLTDSVATPEMLDVAFRRFFKGGAEGFAVLATSLLKEWVHLQSDIGTKNSLPFPIISTVSPELANAFAHYGLDMGNIAAVSKQALYAEAINVIVGMLHGMYCFFTQKAELDGTVKLGDVVYFRHQEALNILELSKVRTRKILLYSNLIASSSNVIAVAIMEIIAAKGGNAELAKKGWDYLDIGGLAVTLYRLVSDTKFIRQVKEEFLANEWHKAVVGEDYRFVAEVESMSKKDIQKGIEIQATADTAKAAKLAAGMQAHAEVLGAIRSTQEQVRGNVDIIMHDQAAQEAARLYGLGETKKIRDLDHTEKRVLGAALYTLMANYQQNSDRQKKFYQCYEQYGVSERYENFNFALLNNIDSFSDRKVILKAICVFLFLKDCNTDFSHDPAFNWLNNFTSADDVDAVCLEIEKEFSIVGDDALLLGYVPALAQPEVSAAPAELVEADAEELSEGEYDYAPLFELVGRYIKDESAFGKQVSPAQAFLDKELGVKHAGVSSNATIAATKVSNGHLIFTTYALYLRVGSMFQGEYVCLPYASIQTRRIATGDGKVKGTRKLIIPYITDSGLASVEIDDTKVQEEKLRELLLEIQTSGGSFATTDKHIPISELPEQIQIDFFSILASVLHSEDHALTEVYLLVRDYGFSERWDEIVENMPVDRVQSKIEEFINAIPYPSEFAVTGEAMRLYLRTICRTNILEGNEATLLSQAEENYAKCFDMIGAMTDAEFSILLKKSAADIRKVSLVELREMRDNIAEGTSCFAAITTTLDALIEKMQTEETARQNTPVAKFVKAVQETATPAAKDIAKKAEEQLKRFGFPGKKAP